MAEYDMANAKGRVFTADTVVEALQDILEWLRRSHPVYLHAIVFSCESDNHAEEIATVFYDDTLPAVPP